MDVNDWLARISACLSEFEVLGTEFRIFFWKKEDEGVLGNLFSYLRVLQQIEI
jgi:hypothetical protein